MKKINNAEDLKAYLNLPDSINVIMNHSVIEIDDSASLEILGDLTMNNMSITVYRKGQLQLGKMCELRGRIIIQPDSKVRIGNRLICNGNMFIHSAESSKIEIGNDCLFANPQIYNSDLHAYYDDVSGVRLNIANDVYLGNKIWIGVGAILLKGTKVQDNSVIGAGAIVSSSFLEDNVVITGNPAKIVRRQICWTRKIYNVKPLEVKLRGSVGEYIQESQKFNNEAVITIGMPIYSEWQNMNKENSYLYYYLARSIFLEYFDQNNITSLLIQGEYIKLSELLDILQMVYDLSDKKNYPCGAYTYKLAKILGKENLVSTLYDEISPHWNAIKQF